MEGYKSPIRLCVPDIDRASLSFCDSTLGGVETWAKKLPMANVGAAAKMLFLATREMNHTQIKSSYRYKMLEIVRSQVYVICESLSKRFIKQSVMLTDSDLKVVSLAQTLQNQLASGYKHIILDELKDSSKRTTDKKLLTFTIHRAITDLSQTILRAYQLYSQPPKNAWLELHQLFALAEYQKIHQYSVKDSQAKYVTNSSIMDVYVRALLLGCCKPNQLRQLDLAHLYEATELWSGLAKLCSGNDQQALFIFAQHKDAPPAYRTLVKPSNLGIGRGLSLHGLVTSLQQHLNKESSAVTIPGNIGEPVINHLIHSWGDMVERSFRRTQNKGDIQIGIGLMACHYFAASNHSLPYLLKKWNADLPEQNKKKSSSDVWDHSFDAGTGGTQETESIDFDSVAFISHNREEDIDRGPKATQIEAQISNTSPGGYGINLENPPSTVQTGELVVIKEANMNNWSLACIRWIRTQRNKNTQIGVELLAPKVEAIAVRILNKTGINGEYLRGIYLPALPIAGQEDSLILPTLPFKTGCKAQLLNDKQSQRIQLLKRINASRSFVQYSYTSLTQALNSNTNKDESGDEFASIWDKL